MRPGGLLVVAWGVLLVASCGGVAEIPGEDHWIGVEVGADAVAPGAAFPLTVRRIWRKDRAAAAWDDRALAPLELRLEALVRDEDDERVRETRRFRAYAFALADVVVPPLAFAARPARGGEPEVVYAPRLTVRVRPTLLPTAAGAPELPGGPLADPARRGPWVILGLGLAGLVGLGLVATRRRRRRRVTETPRVEAPAPSAHSVALERLARLRAGMPDVAATTEIVRAYVATRYAVRAPYLSTEEVLAAPGITGAAARRLAGLFALADRTKFAAHTASPSERLAHLDEAEAFVRLAAEGASS